MDHIAVEKAFSTVIVIMIIWVLKTMSLLLHFAYIVVVFVFLYINSMVPKDVEANHIYCNALYTCIQTGLERQKRLCAGLNPYVCHSTFYP